MCNPEPVTRVSTMLAFELSQGWAVPLERSLMPSIRHSVRDRILDATEVLLARYGYRKMSMGDLARESGVGRGTLYLHFSGKEDIALSSIDRLVERLVSELRVIAGGGAAPSVRMRALLVRRVTYRLQHLHQDSASLDQLFAAIRPAYLGRRQRYLNLEAEVLAGVLAEGARAGEFEVSDPLETARSLLIATNALLPYGLSPAELGQAAAVRADAVRIAELLVRGLSPGRPAALNGRHASDPRSASPRG